MPAVAGMLSVFDCAAWPTAPPRPSWCAPRTPTAHRPPLHIKALSFVAGNGAGVIDPDTTSPTCPSARPPPGRLRPGRDHRPAPSCSWPRSTTASPHRAGALRRTWVLDRGDGLAGSRTARSPSDGDASRQHRRWTEVLRAPRGGVGAAHALRVLAAAAGRGRRPPDPRRARQALVHNLGGYPGEMLSLRLRPRQRAGLTWLTKAGTRPAGWTGPAPRAATSRTDRRPGPVPVAATSATIVNFSLTTDG